MFCTVINDLSVPITSEILPVVADPEPVDKRDIPAGGSTTYKVGGVGVGLALIMGGNQKSAPFDPVVYASEIFPELLEHLQTIVNDLSGTIRAELQVPSPTGPHIVKTQDIPTASSFTFSLFRGIAIGLVVVSQGKTVPLPLGGGKQVWYASDLFPPTKASA